jgi:4,5-DOPA dioxygenase extradiol
MRGMDDPQLSAAAQPLRGGALPPVFISHGSPMTALEPREAGAFMRELGAEVVRRHGRPRALLAVSAHTLTREPVLLAAPRHQAVYDFGGFDPKLETLRYDAPGAPALATRVMALLAERGIAAHRLEQGGLDHGIWTPLRYMLPAADVPVLPLGWPPNWSPERLFALGEALAPLAAEGVWIMGSGSITHNLQRVFAGGLGDVDRAETRETREFCDWFAERAAAADWEALFEYRRLAPHAQLMHPSDEHLLPWYVAAGAGAGAGKAAGGVRLHRSTTYGELAMDAYAFGPGARALAA